MALSLSLHPLSFTVSWCVCCVCFVVVVQVCGARVALGSRKQLICTLPKAAAAQTAAEAAAEAGIATTTTTAKGMCAVGYSCVDFTQFPIITSFRIATPSNPPSMTHFFLRVVFILRNRRYLYLSLLLLAEEKPAHTYNSFCVLW